MKMQLLSSLLLAPLSGALAAEPKALPPRCREVKFQVSGLAYNLNITGTFPTGNLADLLAAAAKAPRVLVNGTQTLAGTYCLPTVLNPNNNKLQTFFSSITANRDSWSAQGGTSLGFPAYQPARYSWVDFANNRGYPTLALDRLGTGLSSHPDPIVVVQAPYEQELYNDLAKQIRAGASQLGRKYEFLIYVGNSYGSQLGAGIAGTHPDAYDQYVLTGYSRNPQQDFAGVSLTLPAPAAIVDPARFGTLSPGYVTTSSQTGRTNSFFGSKAQVAFDDVNAALFFQRKDVVSLGQFVSVYALPYFGGGFTGRILTLTGEQDQAFCGPGSPVIGPAQCGNQLQETGSQWPNAQYNWKSVDKTGHAIQLHYSAQTVFSVAHRFLAGETFQGGPPA